MPIYRLYDNFDRTGYSAPAFMGPEPVPGFKRMTYSPPTLVTPVIDAPHITESNQDDAFVYENLNNWIDYGLASFTRDGRWYPDDTPSFFGSSLATTQGLTYLPVKASLMGEGFSEAETINSLLSSSATYRSGPYQHIYNMGFNYAEDLVGAYLRVGGPYACFVITKGSLEFVNGFGQLSDGFMSIFVAYGYDYSIGGNIFTLTLQIQIRYWQPEGTPPQPPVTNLNLKLGPTDIGAFFGNHDTYTGTYQRSYVYTLTNSLIGEGRQSYSNGVVNMSPFFSGLSMNQDFVYKDPSNLNFSVASAYEVDINPLLSYVDTMDKQYVFDSYCHSAPLLGGYSTAWPDHTKGFYVDDYSYEAGYEEIGSSGWRIGSVLGGSGGSLGSAYIYIMFAPWGGIFPK